VSRRNRRSRRDDYNGFVSSPGAARPMAHFRVFQRPTRFFVRFDWLRLGSFRRVSLN
jgi:hypothetical protein